MSERTGQRPFLERVMLQHATPVKLGCDGAGVALCVHFLWLHEPAPALVSLFGCSVLGNVLVWRRDPDELARTRLGAWMIVQAEPTNMIVRTLGFSTVLTAIWRRSGRLGLAGAAIVVAGRVLGQHRRSARVSGRPGRLRQAAPPG